MEIKWCWRCQMKIPMLDKEEFELCREAIEKGKELVEEQIKKRSIENYKWLGEIPKPYEKLRYFIDMYRLLSGFEETNPNAVWHHLLDEYGEDCPKCEKPLRTKKARYCAACGFGKEDLISADTKPLVERRPELFKKKN